MFRQLKRRHGKTGRRLLLENLESRAMMHAEAVLSGSVYFDMNADGIRDVSELGVPGVVISLSGSDAGGASVDRSTITDGNGIYTFEELDSGTYQISKRQASATIDGQESSAEPATVTSNNLFTNVVLSDDQNLGGNNFGEAGLRPEFITYAWFTTNQETGLPLLRETIARSEERSGDADLAASIRSGGTEVPSQTNNSPVAVDDFFSVEENKVLTVNINSGVLANDTDVDGDTITATLVGQSSNGAITLNSDGSFVYTPNTDFTGTDTFTYQARDLFTNSNVVTVTINVNSSGVTNQSPVAVDDTFSVAQDGVLTVTVASGVIANDTDSNGDSLTASVVAQPSSGTLTLSGDGSFTYAPANGFSGQDTFTYTVSDGAATSNVASVLITVSVVNELFGAVTPGSFESSGLLGTRTDLVVGAPTITASHVNGDIDYAGYSNPPTYGNHHGFDPNGVDGNPGVTPRTTGVYTTEQPEEDVIHNLEHGHVWISYNPSLLSASDVEALQQLVRDGSPNANGGGVGVILTPRAANDTAIALASWARLQTFDQYDPTAIRSFIETNRGQAPEGFITP